MRPTLDDTIAAIATPLGEGGLGVIRVSGSQALAIVRTVFRDRHGRAVEHWPSHRVRFGSMIDPCTGAKLDEVLVTYMRAPHSYTREHVVEISGHGGIGVMGRILEALVKAGARLAEPGEFTKRAFLNGRLDLTQAEAVQDLINARTGKQAELALHQLNGELSKWVDELREELLDILVQVEAAIDFPEEEIELLRRDELGAAIDGLRKKILAITATYNHGRLFREGARVCICGRPNVGKSSLLNALLGQERVIVTPVPGTTRDVIEESINIDGLPVVLWDTAGIRETTDEVEKFGVELSLRHLEKADAVVVVLDGSVSLTEDDRACLSRIENKKSLTVINKIDLAQKCSIEGVREIVGTKSILFVSATRGDGLKDLERYLRELLIGTEAEPQIVLTNVRHKNALIRGDDALTCATSSLRENRPAECVAVDLNEARDALEELV